MRFSLRKINEVSPYEFIEIEEDTLCFFYRQWGKVFN